jgi:hypothetical protein
MKIKILLLLTIILLPVMAKAQSALLDIALIEPSVKANAMGNAFVANNGDVFGMFYNPAQYTKETTLSASYQKGYMEDSTGVFGIKVPTKWDMNVGGSFYYYATGDLDMPGGGEGQKDMMFVLNISKKVYGPLSVGANAKYLSSSLFGEFKATTAMFDLGVLAEFKYFNLGASLMNMGGSLQYHIEKEDIPTATRFGFLVHNTEEDLIGLAAGLDYVILKDEKIIRVGAEAGYNKLFAGRIGYEKGDNSNGGFSFGAGVNIEKFTVDYAFTSYSQVKESVHKIGLSYKL